MTIGLIAFLIGALMLPFPLAFGSGLVIGLLSALAVRATVAPRERTGEAGLTEGLTGGLIGGAAGSLSIHIVLAGTISLDGAGPVILGGLAIGIAVASMKSFLAGLIGGFLGGFGGWLVESFSGVPSSTLAAHLVNGLGLGLAAGLAAGLANRRTPTRGLRWSSLGLICGLVTGIATGAAVWVQTGATGGIAVGLAATLAGGYVGGLLFGTAETDLTKAIAPGTVLSRDRAAFLTSFLGLGLAMGIGNGLQVGITTSNDGSPDALRVGLEIAFVNLVVVGLAFGFLQACWGSFTLARWWLAASGRLPWRLMSFLADAHTHHGVLRQTGAVYQFRHAELQRHLARLRDARSGPTTPPA